MKNLISQILKHDKKILISKFIKKNASTKKFI